MDNNSTVFFGETPIYIINLKDSINRKNHILNEFKECLPNVHFIDAVDGRDENFFNTNYRVNYHSNINFGKALIAVICSHAKAIYNAYCSGMDNACIFEDDIHLDLIKKCNFTLDDICKLNANWDTIQLFYCNDIEHYYNDYLTNGLDRKSTRLNSSH